MEPARSDGGGSRVRTALANLPAGGPEALFAGKPQVIDSIFRQLDVSHGGLAKAL